MNVNSFLFADEFRGVGFPPGYRDCTIHLKLNDGSGPGREIELVLTKEASSQLLQELWQVHECAWRDEQGPIDRETNERRPAFVFGAEPRIIWPTHPTPTTKPIARRLT